MASFSSVGCDLRYQDTTKLLTTNTGVTVTGTVAATSYTGDGSSLTGVASTVADGCIYENSQTISNNYNNHKQKRYECRADHGSKWCNINNTFG